MAQVVEQVGILLLVAAAVAMTARRWKVPYAVGLVLAGIALGAVTDLPQVPLTEPLILFVLLPPLIFDAAISTAWFELRRDLGLVLLLATVGVLVTAG